MIHEAECHIVVERGLGFSNLTKAEPPIPTDAQIEEVFPNWKLKAKAFVVRCCQQEKRNPANLSTQDIFRYGMKFAICESTKLC